MTLVTILLEKNKDKLERLAEIERKYNELIMAVSSKYPGETRHNTALRYIGDRENFISTDVKTTNIGKILADIRKISKLGVCLLLVVLTGCAASWHYRNQNTQPLAIIQATDMHGVIITWELDYTIRSLKVTTDLKLKYEHEYMVDAPHPEKL